MKTHIKRINRSLPLPEYKTKGSVAFDLSSRVSMKIKPGAVVIVPLNVIVKPPPGHFFVIASRSSLAMKKGVMIANGIGVIDADYCGEEDEWSLQVFNFTKKVVKIEAGERLAQGILVKQTKATLVEVSSMKSRSRGGWGSTGYR